MNSDANVAVSRQPAPSTLHERSRTRVDVLDRPEKSVTATGRCNTLLTRFSKSLLSNVLSGTLASSDNVSADVVGHLSVKHGSISNARGWPAHRLPVASVVPSTHLQMYEKERDPPPHGSVHGPVDSAWYEHAGVGCVGRTGMEQPLAPHATHVPRALHVPSAAAEVVQGVAAGVTEHVADADEMNSAVPVSGSSTPHDLSNGMQRPVGESAHARMQGKPGYEQPTRPRCAQKAWLELTHTPPRQTPAAWPTI